MARKESQELGEAFQPALFADKDIPVELPPKQEMIDPTIEDLQRSVLRAGGWFISPVNRDLARLQQLRIELNARSGILKET